MSGRFANAVSQRATPEGVDLRSCGVDTTSSAKHAQMLSGAALGPSLEGTEGRT
jgi:hypothetical protein